jgi:hypothetical protein
MEFGSMLQVAGPPVLKPAAIADSLDALARERGTAIAGSVIAALQQELDGTGGRVLRSATEVAVCEIRSYLDTLAPNSLRQPMLIEAEEMPANRQQELVTKAQDQAQARRALNPPQRFHGVSFTENTSPSSR